jgi:hypothetical protein
MKSLWILALLTACLGAPAKQAKPGQAPPPPLPPGSSAPAAGAPVLDLKRGELPSATTKEARKAWDKLIRASLPKAAPVVDEEKPPPLPERAPVSAFDLSIDVRYRASDAQSNDMPKARYRWLAPGFVRADTGRGRSHVRGPKGSFLLDESKPDHVERIPLDTGRENLDDMRQLDEQAGLATNFAGLTDPRSLRIARLATAAAPMSSLPESLQQRARELTWLDLETPDFTAMRSSRATGQMARVQLGMDPVSSLPEIAVVDDAARHPGLSEGTSVLQLADYKAVDDFRVPFHIRVWLPHLPDPDEPARRVTLRQQPAMEMYVTKASLRADLKPQDFVP